MEGILARMGLQDDRLLPIFTCGGGGSHTEMVHLGRDYWQNHMYTL
jgi:hypothetical protein